MSVSVNTPFTILFNYKDMIVPTTSTITINRLGKDFKVQGTWQLITLVVPFIDPFVGKQSVTIKAFITNQMAPGVSQNILGLSPGPYTLKDYQFYYNFGQGSLSSVEITITKPSL